MKYQECVYIEKACLLFLLLGVADTNIRRKNEGLVTEKVLR